MCLLCVEYDVSITKRGGVILTRSSMQLFGKRPTKRNLEIVQKHQKGKQRLKSTGSAWLNRFLFLILENDPEEQVALAVMWPCRVKVPSPSPMLREI